MKKKINRIKFFRVSSAPFAGSAGALSGVNPEKLLAQTVKIPK